MDRSSPPSGSRALLWILALAAAVRLVMLMLVPEGLGGDASDYHALAVRLVRGEGFVSGDGGSTALRPPGYPFFLAGIYALFGEGLSAPRWIQVVIDLGLVALVYRIGERVYGRRPGLFAAFLVAVNLATAAAPARILSETLFTVLLVGSLLLLVCPSGVRGLGAGALMGLATLTRGFLVGFPPVAALWLWRGRGRPRAAALLLLGWGLVLAPWTARNAVVFDAFVPVSTQVGHTLYSSYNPPDGWRFGFVTRDSVTAAARTLPEPAMSRELVEATGRSIARDPVRLVRLEALKVGFFLAPFDWEILPWYGAFNPTWALLVIVLLVGVVARRWGGWTFRARRAERGGSLGVPLWLAVGYVGFMVLIFYGSPRFRLPVEPVLAVPAGAVLDAWWRERGERRAGVEVGTIAVLLASAAFVAEPAKAWVRSWIGSGG